MSEASNKSRANSVEALFKRYAIEDTDVRNELVRIAELAAKGSQSSFAVIAFFLNDRLILKVCHGFKSKQSEVRGTLFEKAVGAEEINIADAATSGGDRSIEGIQTVAFFASVPLFATSGAHIGFLAVMDPKPKSLPSEGIQTLHALARSAALELDQKAHVAELMESLRVCKGVIEEMPLMVFVKDVQDDFRFVVFNQAAERITGIMATACVGKTDFDFFPQEQARFFREKDIQTISSKEPVEINEEPIQTAQGERFLRTKKVVLRDHSGNPKFLLGISEDISASVKAQRLIKDQQLQLIRSAKLSALGEMAAGVAHEINNPMTVIHGKAEQLRSSLALGNPDTKKMIEHVSKIEDMVQRVAKIIRSLRYFSRKSEQDPLTKESVATIVSDAAELFRERLRNSEVEFKVVAANDCMVMCRPSQISEVLFNLFSNALDAVQNLSDKWIRIEFFPTANGFVEIAVIDSGLGISPEIAEKLMNPFFTTKGPGKGTGLGLSLSRGLAEANQGCLKYDAASKHTRFVLKLPAVG